MRGILLEERLDILGVRDEEEEEEGRSLESVVQRTLRFGEGERGIRLE